jgi:hypothetical protein
MKRLVRQLFALSLCSFTVACASVADTPSPTAFLTLSPTQPAAATTPAQLFVTQHMLPTATPEPVDTGWIPVAQGIVSRQLLVETKAGRERLHLVRLDPQIRLRVLYQPAHPRTVSQWAEIFPSAMVVTNAGYFTPDNQATGLIISDGIAEGRSHGPYAGMLAVHADGQTTLRWLQTWPYSPNERLVQAVQSFPVLVKPGGLVGFPIDADEGKRSRRTVVAQDNSGRLILLVSPGFHFSLHELAVWLTESDLELDIAMNLDGGTSTGLWIKDHASQIDSLVPVPAVIVIEPIHD